MKFTIRKCVEQQALLMTSAKETFLQPIFLRKKFLMFSAIILFLVSSFADADIYRFVAIDGVETFTDAPSDKSAKIVIKDRQVARPKELTTTKKTKTHDISLNEIAQKTVSAMLNQLETESDRFEPHLPPIGGVITSKVGMRIDPIDGIWRQHNGIDIAIPTGTPIKPAASGVVVYSGKRSGYGNTVIIEHNNGVITLYAHNSRNLVTEGQPVTADSIIALSGSTGRSTGPHLHFEAWQAGTNVTMAFLPNSRMTLPNTTILASSQQASHFRSETLSDGSVLFTNIPASIP